MEAWGMCEWSGRGRDEAPRGGVWGRWGGRPVPGEGTVPAIDKFVSDWLGDMAGVCERLPPPPPGAPMLNGSTEGPEGEGADGGLRWMARRRMATIER